MYLFTVGVFYCCGGGVFLLLLLVRGGGVLLFGSWSGFKGCFLLAVGAGVCFLAKHSRTQTAVTNNTPPLQQQQKTHTHTPAPAAKNTCCGCWDAFLCCLLLGSGRAVHSFAGLPGLQLQTTTAKTHQQEKTPVRSQTLTGRTGIIQGPHVTDPYFSKPTNLTATSGFQ